MPSAHLAELFGRQVAAHPDRPALRGGTELTYAQLDRRAAGVAARAVTNASSVALGLPAQDAAEVRAATEGYLLGSYTYTAYKSKPGPST